MAQKSTSKTHFTLERVLSKRGLVSRKEARSMIIKGLVKVNGQTMNDPLRPVHLAKAKIEIEQTGQAGPALPSMTSTGIALTTRVLLLHKTSGTVTTKSDEKGRKTIYSHLPKIEHRLHPIGRLDLASSGLLLLTDNTRFSSWLTDPKNGIPRVYLVTVRGEVTPATLDKISEGIESDGENLQASEVVIRKASGKETHLVVTLNEGKNREIRRLFLACGHEVTRLKRVSFGGLSLGDLKPAQHREVPLSELKKAFPDFSW